MIKHIAVIGALLALSAGSALATPQDPQRIVPGQLFPVYLNNTGTNQTITQAAYVNQTQYTPATAGTTRLMFRPTP